MLRLLHIINKCVETFEMSIDKVDSRQLHTQLVNKSYTTGVLCVNGMNVALFYRPPSLLIG